MISSNALPSASPGAQDPSNAPYSSGRVYDMTNRWRPTEGAAESLLFDGAPKLVELLEELIQRPRSWRREHLLPIVYLILPDQDTPLHGIDDRFRQSARIISSRVGADPTDADDTASGILGLLNQIVADLSSATKGTGRLKFPHYSPAVWLHGLTMDGTNDQPDQLDKLVYLEFKNFIRRRYPVVSQAGGTADPVDQFPAYIRAITRAIPPLAVALMRAFWRPPRWIARRHEVGRSHGQPSFMQLARTFMERTVRPSVRAPISANKIDQLLVDAFLEDLWRSYRRYTVFGQGRRRMSYPVALIEDGRAGSAASNCCGSLRSRETGQDCEAAGLDHFGRIHFCLWPVATTAATPPSGRRSRRASGSCLSPTPAMRTNTCGSAKWSEPAVTAPGSYR